MLVGLLVVGMIWYFLNHKSKHTQCSSDRSKVDRNMRLLKQNVVQH